MTLNGSIIFFALAQIRTYFNCICNVITNRALQNKNYTIHFAYTLIWTKITF